ncbi:MAG: ATP synthase subunit I [Polaromonas sp.]|nr:ATP synthase subunit I [Polaromonas sp.]
MSKIALFPASQVDGDAEPDFKPLTAEQARALREQHPGVSPWRVLVVQAVVGAVVTLLAWLVTGKPSVGWSAAYGALAVIIPAAVFARGLTSRLSSLNAGAAMLGFFLWEAVKIGLVVAMLFAAPRVVEGLSRPALLVGLVVTMKAVWLMLLQQRAKGRR